MQIIFVIFRFIRTFAIDKCVINRKKFANMEEYRLIGSIIIGGIAGLLAGKLVKGEGYGCFINVL